MQSHVLVVEDDPTTCTVLAHLLQEAGYCVTQVSDGETALDVLEKEAFSVVLTDIVMGDVGGVEVLHTARSQPYQPVVILLTGYGTLETCIDALRAGAFDYLLKPCADEKILETVHRAAKHYQKERNIIQAVDTLSEIVSGQPLDSAARGAPTTTGYQLPNGKHGPVAKDDAPKTNQSFQVGALFIGATRHRVTLNDDPLAVTPIEFALLRYLAQTPGETRSYSSIAYHTHQLLLGSNEAQNLLRPHARNLRRKLGQGYLVNETGCGYVLHDPNMAGVMG